MGTLIGWARMVPDSSRTEPLIPPPPQSIANVVVTRPKCARLLPRRVTAPDTLNGLHYRFPDLCHDPTGQKSMVPSVEASPSPVYGAALLMRFGF